VSQGPALSVAEGFAPAFWTLTASLSIEPKP